MHRGARFRICKVRAGTDGMGAAAGPTLPLSRNARQLRPRLAKAAFGMSSQERFRNISFAAINPPPAIRIAASARLALGLAKPARIRNMVDNSGVA